MPESGFARFLRITAHENKLVTRSSARRLAFGVSELDVEDRVRHCDGLIGRGAIDAILSSEVFIGSGRICQVGTLSTRGPEM
jgi:hypothetical protein